LRSRRIKLRPTLHVGWLAVFRAIRLALGIIFSGKLGFVSTANQNAEQPAPQKPAHRAPFAPVGGSEYTMPVRCRGAKMHALRPWLIFTNIWRAITRAERRSA
jgi:hypothetical protein